MSWNAGTPEKAYAEGMAAAIKTNNGDTSLWSSNYQPPRDYKDAYDAGWNAHIKK